MWQVWSQFAVWNSADSSWFWSVSSHQKYLFPLSPLPLLPATPEGKGSLDQAGPGFLFPSLSFPQSSFLFPLGSETYGVDLYHSLSPLISCAGWCSNVQRGAQDHEGSDLNSGLIMWMDYWEVVKTLGKWGMAAGNRSLGLWPWGSICPGLSSATPRMLLSWSQLWTEFSKTVSQDKSFFL